MAIGMLHYATHTRARIFAPRPFDFLGDARAVVNQAPSGLGPSGFHPCRNGPSARVCTPTDSGPTEASVGSMLQHRGQPHDMCADSGCTFPLHASRHLLRLPTFLRQARPTTHLQRARSLFRLPCRQVHRTLNTTHTHDPPCGLSLREAISPNASSTPHAPTLRLCAREGSEVYAILAMLDMLPSALLRLANERVASDVRLCRSACLARGSVCRRAAKLP